MIFMKLDGWSLQTPGETLAQRERERSRSREKGGGEVRRLEIVISCVCTIEEKGRRKPYKTRENGEGNVMLTIGRASSLL
jgi:hypothetical protein